MSTEQISRKHLRPRRRWHHSERGSALLFIAAIVLPFCFFLLSLTLDMALYFQEQKQAQALLDKAGIRVQRFLPYVDEARTAFESVVSESTLLKSGATSFDYRPESSASDVITLTYTRPFVPSFANLIGSDVQIPLSVRSLVRVSPFDLQIYLDTSSYLAPPLTATSGWYPSHEQPATLFQQGTLSYLHDLDGDGAPNSVDPLVASQQCFSPALLALKEAAIETYQYFASFRDNALGVGVFPAGTGAFTDVLRSYGSTSRPNESSSLTFHSWDTPFVKNEHCAAAAERESRHRHLTVPLGPDAFIGLWRGSDGGEFLIDQPSGWQVNPSYGALSVEQVIWSQSVRYHERQDTPGVLQSIAFGLFSAPPIDTRGGLINEASKQAILFAGDLPWSNGVRYVDPVSGAVNPGVESALQEALEQMGQVVESHEGIEFRLFYLAFHHEGLPGTLHDFRAGADHLGRLLERVERSFSPEVQERFTAQLFVADDAQQLSEQVISTLALSRRGGVISQ
ncbi:hypothetical protein MRY87_00125 [bacterium]|nr:hypothetical protein [bacterium]